MDKHLQTMTKKEKEEYLANRIAINFGLILVGYVLLYLFYQATSGRMGVGAVSVSRYVLAVLFGLLLAGAVTLYALSGKRVKLKNYAHALLGCAVAAAYIDFAFLFAFLPASWMLAIPNLIRNPVQAIPVVCILLLVYLIGMLIYNSRMLAKRSAKSTKKTHKK